MMSCMSDDKQLTPIAWTSNQAKWDKYSKATDGDRQGEGGEGGGLTGLQPA